MTALTGEGGGDSGFIAQAGLNPWSSASCCSSSWYGAENRNREGVVRIGGIL